MIQLTRLSGSKFVLNSDLIERIDSTPDTVISLTDGTKYVVAESMLEVVGLVRTFRSEIVALSSMIPPDTGHLTGQVASTPPTRLVPVTPLPTSHAQSSTPLQET